MKNLIDHNKHKKYLGILLIVLGTILFAACSNSPAPELATATSTPPTSTPEPTATSTPLPPTATPEPTATAEPVATSAPSSATATAQPSGAANTQSSPSATPTGNSALSIIVSPGMEGDDAAVRAIFDGASEAIQNVDSFHFELEAIIQGDSDTSGSLASGGIPISLIGDFQAPDRIRGSMLVSLGFFEFQMETISIGDTTYVTDPQTGEWEIAPGESVGIPNPADLTGFGGDSLDNLKLLGEEVLDGVSVYHFRGTPPDDAFGSADDDAVVADFWIGVDDLLFRKIVASGAISMEGGADPFGGALGGTAGAATSADSATLELTMTFSNYNEPVVIEPPEL